MLNQPVTRGPARDGAQWRFSGPVALRITREPDGVHYLVQPYFGQVAQPGAYLLRLPDDPANGAMPGDEWAFDKIAVQYLRERALVRAQPGRDHEAPRVNLRASTLAPVIPPGDEPWVQVTTSAPSPLATAGSVLTLGVGPGLTVAGFSTIILNSVGSRSRGTGIVGSTLALAGMFAELLGGCAFIAHLTTHPERVDAKQASQWFSLDGAWPDGAPNPEPTRTPLGWMPPAHKLGLTFTF